MMYIFLGLAIVGLLSQLIQLAGHVIGFINDIKEEEKRELEIAKGPQGKMSHNPKGDFFYDRF